MSFIHMFRIVIRYLLKYTTVFMMSFCLGAYVYYTIEQAQSLLQFTFTTHHIPNTIGLRKLFLDDPPIYWLCGGGWFISFFHVYLKDIETVCAD